MEKDIYEINQRSYNSIAKTFSSRHSICGTFKPALDKFCKNLKTDDVVLDVGCGPGRDATEIAKYDLRVIGIDSSIEMVRLSRNIHQFPVAVMDIRCISFSENYFQGLWVNSVIHHLKLEDVPIALHNFHRVLVPGGIIFISCRFNIATNWDQEYPDYPRYYNRITGENLVELIEKTPFTITNIEELKSPKSQKSWINIEAIK